VGPGKSLLDVVMVFSMSIDIKTTRRNMRLFPFLRLGISESLMRLIAACAALGGPAISQHYQLGALCAVHNFDDIGRILSLGEARGFVGHRLLIAERARHAVVQDVEAFVFAHAAIITCV
jgi:hypothetical protein